MDPNEIGRLLAAGEKSQNDADDLRERYDYHNPPTGTELLRNMCQVPDPQGADEEIVAEALKAFRKVALCFDRGGLAYQYKLSKAALEAFKRLVDPQASFLRWANQGAHDVDDLYRDEED